MIDVKKLNKSFGDNHVLKDIDEHISRGEKVVIVGPSGSGKSTCVRCLNLMEIPSSEIYSLKIRYPKTKARIECDASKMGMVFQHFNLFPRLTILIISLTFDKQS